MNLLTDMAVRNSDKLIAISEATKKDILKFYPKIKEDKIKVIYHGFDPEVFSWIEITKRKVISKKSWNIRQIPHIYRCYSAP